MTPEHLSPAQRDMLRAAQREIDRMSRGFRVESFVHPAAVIDLLTQLGEARAALAAKPPTFQRTARQQKKFDKMLQRAAMKREADALNQAQSHLAARPATAEGTV